MIRYGQFEVEPDALPQISKEYLMARGVSWYMGNAVASKIVAAEAAAKKKGEVWDKDRAELLTQKLRKEAWRALLAGEVTGRASGDRLVGFDWHYRHLLDADIKAAAAAAGVKAKDLTDDIVSKIEEQLLAVPEYKVKVEAEAQRRVDADNRLGSIKIDLQAVPPAPPAQEAPQAPPQTGRKRAAK